MNEITAKRLAVIRLLFEKGKAMSNEGEPMNGLCLLPFHDCVEMFLKLCADEKGIQMQRNASFMSYFDMIPELQDKVQMNSLNSRRVSLKHHGQFPSTQDVAITRVNVIDFFEHNTPIFFSCKLDDVSLEVLIEYQEVRKYLSLYHDYVKQGKYGEAQAQCQIAFQALLASYHRKYNQKYSLKDGPAEGLRWLHGPNFEKQVDEYLKTLKDAVESLNEAISLMNLGINYYSYRGFVSKGPFTQRWAGMEEDQYEYYIGDSSNYTIETANDCYQFVIDTALKLQGAKVFMN